MHLLRAALAHYGHNLPEGSILPRPRLIYFANPSEFPEVLELVRETSGRYDLNLKAYENLSFAAGLKACIAEEGGALAFLLGTRKVSE